MIWLQHILISVASAVPLRCTHQFPLFHFAVYLFLVQNDCSKCVSHVLLDGILLKIEGNKQVYCKIIMN